jgi:CheY-like chemotaxis protein
MSTEKVARPIVLTADDDANDRETLRYAAVIAQPQFELKFVHDGEQVLQYLRREGGYASDELFPLPKLLVMDVHMPKVNGMEVLAWLEASTAFKDLKVIMLTGSMDPQMLASFKKNNARCFQKPMDVRGWIELVRGLQMLLTTG